MSHLGDPCIHCGVAHNDIAPGDCPSSAGLAATMRNIYHLSKILAEHEDYAAKVSANLKDRIAEYRTIASRVEAGLDVAKIALAETVVMASDYSKGGEERASARADAIQQFSTGKPVGPYKDLRREFFGTKNYDRWSGQRCDCEYGMGPRHGSICFQIGMKKDVRQRDLTHEEREAAVYYLVNLEAIQASKVAA